MRASPTEQTESVGVDEVKAAFAKIGWGAAENDRHDLGTDLFVQARDARLFDLGLVVGVQVKAGPSYFRRRAAATADTPTGWWFTDRDNRHTDAWLAHGLPHLLVLHDVEQTISYWVHITPETVEDTGQGVKILVPEANVINADHRDALLAVAGTGRAGVPLEGTAWTGATPPAARDRLRFALVVPRLVAPHPNASGDEVLTSEQATALLMQARLQELGRYADTFRDVPDLREAREHESWPWRFVGALAGRIVDADLDPLRAALDDAPDPGARAATAVVLASSLIEDALSNEALATLDPVLEADESSPIDDAWLRVQRARALAEMGRVEEARAEASAVQAVRSTSRHDVTATAISGVAAALLFSTASWDRRDLAGSSKAPTRSPPGGGPRPRRVVSPPSPSARSRTGAPTRR